MGSTGSGSFSDYSRRKPANAEEKTGGASGSDNCGMAFSTRLEEVARCYYFINAGDVPAVNTEVVVAFNGLRLVAETSLGEELGYLPTKFNYLRLCLADGFQYRGVVVSSSKLPSPNISVDIVPV